MSHSDPPLCFQVFQSKLNAGLKRRSMSFNKSFPFHSALADNFAIFKLLDWPVRATNNPEVSRTCAFA